MTHSNERMAQLILDNLHLNQHVQEESKGPRYVTTPVYGRKNPFITYQAIPAAFVGHWGTLLTSPQCLASSASLTHVIPTPIPSAMSKSRVLFALPPHFISSTIYCVTSYEGFYNFSNFCIQFFSFLNVVFSVYFMII